MKFLINNYSKLKGNNLVIKKLLRMSARTILLIAMIIQVLVPHDTVTAQDDELPIYIIQSGDTLNSIALRFNVSADEIVRVNGIANPNLLNLGDRIKIPGLTDISGILTSKVIPLGVSLSSLSRSNGISPDDLVTLNKFTSPVEVAAGVTIIIPVKEDSLDRQPLTTVNESQVDLAYAIRNNISPWQIKIENRLSNTVDYFSGDMLFCESKPESDQSSKFLVKSINTSSLPLIQGQTLEVILNTSEPVTIAATLGGVSIPFFEDMPNQYVTLHGIHALTEPGYYPIEINLQDPSGFNTTIEQLVLITDGGYAQDPVIYVDDIYVNPETIAAEDISFNQIVDQANPERRWEGIFQSPISDPSCIVGYYGNRRSYNDGALYYYHTGVDFSVCIAENLYVYAPAIGQVVFAEETVIRGNMVILDHGWGVYSIYLHLSEINVNMGDLVNTGDLLGVIGNTGRSAGPHLHFEINVNGTPINPLDWLGTEYP